MRLNWSKINRRGFKAMLDFQAEVNVNSLDPKLVELVKIRASQINGCAYCLDMHSKDACAIGESEIRIYLLPAWRDTEFYSAKERAALAWCEALTSLPGSGAPDKIYKNVEEIFSPGEITELTLVIVAINSWNRLMVGFQAEAGNYVSNRKPEN